MYFHLSFYSFKCPVCATDDKKRAPCVFPFKIQGPDRELIFNSCTYVWVYEGLRRSWCPVNIKPNTTIDYETLNKTQWGYCASGCPIPGIIKTDSNITLYLSNYFLYCQY